MLHNFEMLAYLIHLQLFISLVTNKVAELEHNYKYFIGFKETSGEIHTSLKDIVGISIA